MTPKEIYKAIDFMDPDEFLKSQMDKNLFSIDLLSSESDLLRQTGKTTSRVIQAISLAMSGDNVLYITDNKRQNNASFYYAQDIISRIKNKTITTSIDGRLSYIFFPEYSNSRIKFSTKLEELFTQFDVTKNNYTIKDLFDE